MAKFEHFACRLYDIEGGFVNNKADRGGPTNRGVTLETFKSFYGHGTIEDIRELTFAQFSEIAKKLYWDRWRADEINNQSVAEFLVDWVYNSGVWGIKIPQRILKVKEDGLVGNNTINVLNTQEKADGALLFCNLQHSREMFYRDITRKSQSQLQFLKGWINRNNSFKYIKS